MSVTERTGRRPSYVCSMLRSDYGLPLCQSVTAAEVESWVAEQVLEVIQPAALEASLDAAADGRAATAAGGPALGAADRAGAVRGGPGRPAVPGVRAREPAGGPDPGAALGGGAAGGPAVGGGLRPTTPGRSRGSWAKPTVSGSAGWPGKSPRCGRRPTTTPADRRQVVRLLVERVVLTVDPGDDRVAVRVEWAGGAVRERVIPRAVRGYKDQQLWPRLSERLAALHGRGETPEAIAAALDRDGFRPPKRASRFTAGMVRRLLHELGLRPRVPRRPRRPGSCPRTSGGYTTWRGIWSCRRTRCTGGGRRAGFTLARSAAVAARGRCGRTRANWPACER